ncbi:cupin domain-containing protein [Paenarthrobacter sp. NPDC057981]|uniref:cupin domain-containing protein n=1 Tax=Paenarthrobacter sp. NPDC057981 TaxID=3346297 RepID=UPI0036DB2985
MMLEAYELTITSPGGESWFTHEGEDLVIVLSGKLLVEFEGGEPMTLNEGDSLHHPGHLAHKWHPIGSERVRVVHVVASGGHAHGDSSGRR